MKKKIFTVLLSAALVFGTTGGAFGASKISFTSLSLAEASQKLQQIYESYFAKYPDHGPALKPGGSSGEGAGSESAGGGSVGSGESSLPSVSVTQTVSGKQGQVVSLVNKERESRGLSPLTTDAQVQKLAQMKAEDMAKKGYFSHTSPTYGSAFDMMAQYGVSYRAAGENIARGQKTAESVMSGWMNSQGHRANILSSSYTKIGVGYATDERGTPYWVQMFIG